MSLDTQNALEKEKRARLLSNFKDDVQPLLKYIDDPKCTDVYVVNNGKVIVRKFGEGKKVTGETLTAVKARAIILSAAAVTGKHIDVNDGFPKLETVLPEIHNARFTGWLPPCVKFPEFTMRLPAKQVYSLENYVETHRLGKEDYDLICRYIKNRKNILVGGATGSGKTTFSNAVLKKMVEYTPNDAFYIVEDVSELQCEAADRTEILVEPKRADEAVITALRRTPDRIIFGEIRYGHVAYELLKAWNTGHTGNVTTIHADTAKSMIPRITDVLMEKINNPQGLVKAIQLCVHLSPTKSGPIVDGILQTEEIEEDLVSFLQSNKLL
jgi:type IV secretion system protein VirB11